ncbi:MAG: hypothetical protein ABI549_03165 [Flavobacterium sp.]|uniref:hypothetical protein n=1 Tax=Flavobacterium sp. TaxID=239 RepID=UPI003262EAA0
MIGLLALMEVEILLFFSLKNKRLEQTAGIWLAKMRKPFASRKYFIATNLHLL